MHCEVRHEVRSTWGRRCPVVWDPLVPHHCSWIVERIDTVCPPENAPTLVMAGKRVAARDDVRGGDGLLGRRRGAALPGLRLEEDLGDDELAVALLLVGAEVVLVHHPVGLLGLALLAVVGVEHQDLLVPAGPAVGQHRPRLARLVPPRLAADAVVPVAAVHLPALPRPRCVRLGRPVEEVPDEPVLAHACGNNSIATHAGDIHTSIWIDRHVMHKTCVSVAYRGASRGACSRCRSRPRWWG
jgi:hypothetical protein